MNFVYKGVRHNGVFDSEKMTINIGDNNLSIDEVSQIEMTPNELINLVSVVDSEDNITENNIIPNINKKSKK